MSLALPDIDFQPEIVTMDFTAIREDGSRLRCVSAVSGNSSVISFNPKPLPPLPQGYDSLGDFLDTFEADSSIAPLLPEVRRERAMEAIDKGEPLTLRLLRLQCGLSQKELAEQLHTSQAAVSAYEGRTRKPGEDNIRELARIFSVDFNTLMQALQNGEG